MIYFVYENIQFQNQIEYSFETLIQFITDEPYTMLTCRQGNTMDFRDGLVISYGKTCFDLNCSLRIHIFESELFGEDYLSEWSLPRRPLKKYGDVAVIYAGTTSVDNHVTVEPHIIRTDIDILASSFFMLSRYEEYVSTERDELDRFRGEDSIAFKEGFLDYPIVNRYMELLWGWIKLFCPRLQRRPLWGGRELVLFISHDVDHIRKFRTPYPLFRYFFEQKDFKKGLQAVGGFVKSSLNINNDPAYCFDYICGVEKEQGFKSAFYWMASSSYNIKSRTVKDLIHKLSLMGCEIGLHPNIGTYKDVGRFLEEKTQLENVLGYRVAGCRQHYLQTSIPLTWRIQDELGLTYDTSAGFHDVEGYRCGICYPYRVFDIEKNCRLDLVEIPLVIMDTTLRGRYHVSQSCEIIKKHADICKKHSGVLSILWHNDALDQYDWEGRRQLYEETAIYLNSLNPLSLNGRELVQAEKFLRGSG